MDFDVSSVMRAVVAACQTPVIVILLVLLGVAILCIGWILGEYFVERRNFRVFLPRLVEDLKNSGEDSAEVVKKSGLLLRQKQYLIELACHPDLTDAMRESLAVGLEYKERRRYEIIVKITDLIARIAPVFGLLGTLIPLGPGIMALSDGDTATLSASLIVAFDTTSTGLMISVVALIISAIRKRWYKDYMVSFDAIMECMLEVQKTGVAPANNAKADDTIGSVTVRTPNDSIASDVTTKYSPDVLKAAADAAAQAANAGGE